ncbi:MAG: methyltransferase domain-containing protein [Vicinamibacterales bacterium]
MPRDIDLLTSPSLKHLRDRWWDETFQAFLHDTLQPRPGKRMLDVGCGSGGAAVYLGLHVAQVEIVGIDLVPDRAHTALEATRDHNVRARFAAGDARRLPFAAETFDSVFAIAVLQHVADPAGALRECRRVVRAGGRVLVVEPENAIRHWTSSGAAGEAAYAASRAFFDAWEEERAGPNEPRLGPLVPSLCHDAGLEPLDVRVFPVAETRLGAPAPPWWEARMTVARTAVSRATRPRTRQLGERFLAALDDYRAEAALEGRRFVELQTTLLYATAAQASA